MKKYLFTSDKFSGEVELNYNDKGWLVSFDIRANFSSNQHEWFLNTFPKDLPTLAKIVENSVGSKLTECIKEVTFDLFWNAYADKINSSKVKTRKVWIRMTKVNQVAAYNYIPKYIAHLPQGVRKKYAETYLNAELWNN